MPSDLLLSPDGTFRVVADFTGTKRGVDCAAGLRVALELPEDYTGRALHAEGRRRHWTIVRRVISCGSRAD